MSKSSLTDEICHQFNTLYQAKAEAERLLAGMEPHHHANPNSWTLRTQRLIISKGFEALTADLKSFVDSLSPEQQAEVVQFLLENES